MTRSMAAINTWVIASMVYSYTNICGLDIGWGQKKIIANGKYTLFRAMHLHYSGAHFNTCQVQWNLQ